MEGLEEEAGSSWSGPGNTAASGRAVLPFQGGLGQPSQGHGNWPP